VNNAHTNPRRKRRRRRRRRFNVGRVLVLNNLHATAARAPIWLTAAAAAVS